MNSLYTSLVVIATSTLLLTSPTASAGIQLSHEGQARADIVIAPDALPPEQHAARELARFLHDITGATFTISTNLPANPAAPNHILVGTTAARLANSSFSIADLGTDGIAIETTGHHLTLAGQGPRGTLYAVYSFLEDQLGCRWWTSSASTIPRNPSVNIDTLNIRYTPTLEYREPFWFDAHDADWAARNKSNGNSVRCDESRGGKQIYEGFVHTFNSLIPPAQYFEQHPEWFSELNGKRTADHSQLCLSNQTMREELIKNLKTRLHANPAATIASVSQNDWFGHCTCESCKTIDTQEGSPAGSMIRFVNAVAEAIEPEFPHIAISTLAYQYTRKPPLLTKPRHNVIVQLCSIECSFSVPLSHERNQDFRDDIIGWSKISNRLYIWDYVTNFRHHLLPHPNLRVLGPNVRFFVDHNVKGIFEQGAYTTNGAEMAELRAWVLAKLLWNPNLNPDALIREFLQGYFGPAAQPIHDYLTLIHDAAAAAEDKLGCFADIAASPVRVSWPTNDKSKFLTLVTMTRALELLNQAERSVRNQPDLLFRVQCAKLPVQYAFMMCWLPWRKEATENNLPWPMPNTIQQAHDDFLSVAKQNHVTRLDEWNEGFGNLNKALETATTN
ncbi:MAG: hypothetical protein RI897_1325 [Verrucomicrobiota bacterium]|jgi:hypothetical protein